MGRNKIPEETKRAVMTLYYGSPKSFGQIAKILGIAKSTAYRILNEGDRQDRELDLGRVLAVNLGKNGLDVEQYAKLIRAASRLGVWNRYGNGISEGSRTSFCML